MWCVGRKCWLCPGAAPESVCLYIQTHAESQPATQTASLRLRLQLPLLSLVFFLCLKVVHLSSAVLPRPLPRSSSPPYCSSSILLFPVRVIQARSALVVLITVTATTAWQEEKLILQQLPGMIYWAPFFLSCLFFFFLGSDCKIAHDFLMNDAILSVFTHNIDKIREGTRKLVYKLGRLSRSITRQTRTFFLFFIVNATELARLFPAVSLRQLSLHHQIDAT